MVNDRVRLIASDQFRQVHDSDCKVLLLRVEVSKMVGAETLLMSGYDIRKRKTPTIECSHSCTSHALIN